ncbi:MAG: ankyrin repeat domain-containing protein, partial [Acidobacteriota bacterium]
DGDTPLMFAAANDKSSVVDALVAAGADINLKNKKGDSALIFATRRDHMKIAKKLLEKGATPAVPAGAAPAATTK